MNPETFTNPGTFALVETFPETNVICEIFVNLKETPSQLRGTN